MLIELSMADWYIARVERHPKKLTTFPMSIAMVIKRHPQKRNKTFPDHRHHSLPRQIHQRSDYEATPLDEGMWMLVYKKNNLCNERLVIIFAMLCW